MATTYKQKIIKARQLMADARENVYQRVKLCVEVFADQDYRADRGGIDDDVAAKELEQSCLCDLVEVGYTFFDLQALYEWAPSKKQWADARLADLWAAFDQERRSRDGEDRITRKRPNRVTRSEYEEVAKERDWLKTSEKTLRRELDELRDDNATNRVTRSEYEEVVKERDELRDENATLRQQNAVLSGRVEELEKMLERFAVAA